MRILLGVLIVAATLACFAIAGRSYGAEGIGPIAPTFDQCPKPIKGYAMLCPVGQSGSFSMYVSYDGGAYTQLP